MRTHRPSSLAWIAQGDPSDVAPLDYQDAPDGRSIALAREIVPSAALSPRSSSCALTAGTPSPDEARLVAGFAARALQPFRGSHPRDRLSRAFGRKPPGDTSARVCRGVAAERAPARAAASPASCSPRTMRSQPRCVAVRLSGATHVAPTSPGTDAERYYARPPSCNSYDVLPMDVQTLEMDGPEASRAICDRLPGWRAPAHHRDDGGGDAGRP